MRDNFWEGRALDELSEPEWEALCDGCGRCCLNKLQDEDDGSVYYTALACRQLNLDSGRCSNYEGRFTTVPHCTNVRSLHAREPSLSSLPATCAYRLRAENKELPDWHPLLNDKPQAVHQAGVSVIGRVLSEEYVHERDWADHIIEWIEI